MWGVWRSGRGRDEDRTSLQDEVLSRQAPRECRESCRRHMTHRLDQHVQVEPCRAGKEGISSPQPHNRLVHTSHCGVTAPLSLTLVSLGRPPDLDVLDLVDEIMSPWRPETGNEQSFVSLVETDSCAMPARAWCCHR